ncbi:MAG: biopolymer transporter ExbD [Verrucomicrobia bacterium]|jgi:biopolymer transport protein ExbD|nr:biopolymer transporter ExbD [Verrucomicrobiota bacterium]
MKFHRNARMLGGILDAAPVASVFFLVVIFVMIGPLVYTPGIRVQLPIANDLPGTEKPAVTVAVDASNRLFFANQIISEAELKLRLAAAAANSREPLTLVVQADKSVTYDYLVQLTLLARDAGIRDALLATLPRLIAAPESGPSAKP